MANEKFKNFHLSIMQSILPVGMGVVHNAKAGGLKKVIDVFNSNDPFSEFQVDGETSAKILRDKIDEWIPGLGNPVVSVDVAVKENITDHDIDEDDPLFATLIRIDKQLSILSQYVNNDSSQGDDDNS